ncbi:hypothetical protein ACQ4PT_054588 [Festuca glaucescens]
MDSRDSMVVATGSSSSPSPSQPPYFIHHRSSPSSSAAAAATQSQFIAPPSEDYRNNHFDAAPAGPFAFQMGPDPHIAQAHVQGQGLQTETSPPMSNQQHPAKAGHGSHEDLAMKKRGRPRKYKPDVSPPSPLPSQPSTALVLVPATPGPEKRRGRPPGSGKMQQLASLGESFLGSVGTGFTPHVIIIPPGEDVAVRIMSFSQQGPRAVCILSASGAVSTATLHQDASSGSVVTYEGWFEILCLSGSYVVIDDGVSRTRNGGLCIALCGADHRVIGGSIGGVLTAAGTVQVIVGSFMYGGSKKKTKKGKVDQEAKVEAEEANGGGEEGKAEETPPLLMTMAPMQMPHEQELVPPDGLMGGGGWTGMMRQMESRSCNIDINSNRE